MDTSEFLAGYGKVNITPDYSVPLRGYGLTERRMSTGACDPIYATCVAITGTNGETVIAFGLDLTNACDNCFPGFRQAIAKACMIPLDNVHLSCSHMHSGCDMANTKVPSVNDYNRDLENWLVEAALTAMADRKPATISYTSTRTKNLNFVRRYYRADGTPAGDNYGIFSDAPIVRHETDVDNQLQLIKLSRKDSADIILANYQMHPHRNGGSKNTLMTADVVGAFRNELEDKLGVNVVYFTGGSGNVNPRSRIAEENITADYLEQGKAIAAYAIAAESTYKPLPVGPVHAISRQFVGNADHSRDHQLEAAQALYQLYVNGEKNKDHKDELKAHNFNSFYTTACVIRKASAPPTRTTGVFAFSVGSVGFAVVPFELFDTLGMYMKENSPFDATFVLTCANQFNTYLPSALAFKNGGYEVDQCKFEPGTGEVIAKLYVDMLTELHGR